MSRNWHVVNPEESRVVWTNDQQWFASVWLNADGQYEDIAVIQHDNTATPLITGDNANAVEVLERVLYSIECVVFGLANGTRHLERAERSRTAKSLSSRSQVHAIVTRPYSS